MEETLTKSVPHEVLSCQLPNVSFLVSWVIQFLEVGSEMIMKILEPQGNSSTEIKKELTQQETHCSVSPMVRHCICVDDAVVHMPWHACET